MDVIQKAHELADALAHSAEALRYREAEAKLQNDAKAFAKLQALKLENIDLEQIDDPLLQEYLTAYRAFDNLLEAIKFILNSAYDGELSGNKGCNGHCCQHNSSH